MNKLFKNAAAFIISAAMLIPNMSAAAFAEGDPGNTPSVSQPEDIPAPTLKITTSDISTIKSGQNGTFTVTIKNMGSVRAKNILVTISSSEDTVMKSGFDSCEITNIYAGDSKEFYASFQTLETVSSPKQNFTISASYYYAGPNGDVLAETSTVVSAASEVTPEPSDPVLKMTGQALSKPVVPGGEYEYSLTVKNFGNKDVEDVFIQLEASDSLYFVGGTDNAYIEKLGARKSAVINVKFRVTSAVSNVKQGITAHIDYTMTSAGVKKDLHCDPIVTIIAQEPSGSLPAGSSAPNIIVKSYDIGADQIAAGENFELNLTLFNTSSSAKIENLIMTVSPGDAISIYGGSNTFFYQSLGANGEISETIPLKALPNANTGITAITVSFKYDYSKDGAANQGVSEQSIFVPVYQPDKMSFDISVPTYSVYPGNETYITTTYLNKGKSDISNVKAEIVGDIQALSTSKVIGNVAPGANGSFDFVVTPYDGGTCEFIIKITYEDAMMEEIVKEYPVSFMVEDMGMWDDPGGGMDPGFEGPDWGEPIDEEQGGFPWIVLWIGIGVLVAGVIVTIIIVKKKKKKKNILTEADIRWEDDDLESVLSSSEKDKTKV